MSENFLLRRINRRLAKQGLKMHKTRPRWQSRVGEYYVTDANNLLVASFCDLRQWARETGALQAGERVTID